MPKYLMPKHNVNHYQFNLPSATAIQTVLNVVGSRDGNRTHCIKFGFCSVKFDQSDSSVQFWFGLSNSSGLFGLVRLAKDVGSSSVRVLFDSHLYFGSMQSVV